MGCCGECGYYVEPECRRYPPGERGFVRVSDGSWCGEFKAREVIVCPVEEKEKASEARVDEKDEVSEPAKRGWPKGKPRK